ncbi:MAG: extracellular solute-binding protein [Caldicoprobacterales bacterium]
MKGLFKKILVLTLILSVLLSVAACGGATDNLSKTNNGNQEDSSNAANSKNDSSDVDSTSTEKVTFHIYKNGGFPDYPADGGEGKQDVLNALAAYGLPNVDYKVTAIGGDEYYDKLNILAVSGSLPDYMNIDMVTMTNFSDQGLIIPLEDHLENMPAAKDRMRQVDLDAWTYNGHLYAFPVAYLEGAINGPNTTGLIVRADWLEKLDIDIPETIDEFYEMLKAFKEQDPDGNGQDDTFGYIGRDTTLFEDVFGAFGIQPTFWMETEEGLRLGSTLPATKEALAVLQQWYAEGLIDPDIFTNDQSLQDQKLANSKGGVYEGSGFSASVSNPEYAALLNVVPTAKLKGIPAFKGPKGESGRQEAPPGYGNSHAISANCQDVDLLVKFLNWCADDGENGGMYLCSVGVEGKHFELSEDGTKINQFVPYNEIYAYGLGNPIRFQQVVDRRWMEDSAVECFEAFDGMYRENKFWGTTPSMLDYPDTCEELFREYLAKIVMGSLPVDAWDDYVKDFYAMGGDKIEQEVNEAYQALNK